MLLTFDGEPAEFGLLWEASSSLPGNAFPSMKTTLGRLAGLMALSLLLVVSARALTIGDPQELGFINFGIPSGDQDREDYVNHLIGMALGSSDTALGQDFFRSNNDFGALPAAVFSGNGTGTSVDLGTGFTYLFAKYDGPNYGSEVWYVGGLTGTISIPATGGDKYGLSGWTLFTPGTTKVSDGGTTAMLMGCSLVIISLLTRRRRAA